MAKKNTNTEYKKTTTKKKTPAAKKQKEEKTESDVNVLAVEEPVMEVVKEEKEVEVKENINEAAVTEETIEFPVEEDTPFVVEENKVDVVIEKPVVELNVEEERRPVAVKHKIYTEEKAKRITSYNVESSGLYEDIPLIPQKRDPKNIFFIRKGTGRKINLDGNQRF